MSDEDETVAAVRDALSSSIPGMVTRWVVVAEVMEDGGERATWCLTDPGSLSTDTLGLLTYAAERERAGIIRDVLAES